MIVFIIVAAAMAAIACAWVIVPMLRARPASEVAREASNVAILRDQLTELDRDLAQGTIAREQYDTAHREIEQRVIEESQALPSAASATSVGTSASAKVAIAMAAALPIVAAALYFTLGNRSAFDPAAQVAESGGQHELTGAQVNEMVAKLAARLDKEPDNADGWVVLARSYYSLGKMPEATRAFERAVTLVPDNADLLADYADAVAVVDGKLDGRAKPLIERALAADPSHWKALALAGTLAFNAKNYAQAVTYWERLKQSVPADAPMASSVDSSIAEARELGGLKGPVAGAPAVAAAPKAATVTADAKGLAPDARPAPAMAAKTGAPADAKPGTADARSGTAAKSGTAALPGGAVAGEVTLGPSLSGKVAPTDTVFVFARAAQGPKMPLAIVRLQAKDLPAKFAFDDSMAMSPEMKISSQAEVVIGARVSKSGQAMPQSGDLEGLSPPVKIGASGVAVVIDKTLP